MKTQLIKLQDKFILVSAEPKANDWCLVKDHNWNLPIQVNKIENNMVIFKTNQVVILDQPIEDCKKIIAGIPELLTSTKIENDSDANVQHIKRLPPIDFSLLSEADCKTIGWLDVEKLALQNFKDNDDGFISYEDRYNGFIEGFGTAQSLNDRVFSKEDMNVIRDMLVQGALTDMSCSSAVVELDIIIKSLQQTSWDVEVEMEYPDKCCVTKEGKTTMNKGCMERNHCERPKITNNSIKVRRIL